ncbi:hypothetical protein MetfoDRAFT_0431 [Methanotorris formicicus Mc-S-70]|uniref:Uncharacterized protein n=1 Tax=Methanotorris formicicus Mc-S-70 TaxID=647171 RepID=H1KXA8_9EURY|nr:hypothetical protein MetfoDRAFT_0431 [Methanotorris formicicus Mc-S-70]
MLYHYIRICLRKSYANFLDLDVKGDICFVDLFPYMESDIYLKKAKELADEVIVV